MSARSPLICSAVELWYKKMLKIGSLSELTGIDTKIKVAGFQRLYSKWLWLLMAVYKPSFAETAYTKECKSDTKVAKRVGELQRRKEELEGKISELRRDIKKQEEVASTYQLKLDDLEKHQATSERYQEIKDRLKTKNEKLSRLKSLILVNYNAGLLDNF